MTQPTEEVRASACIVKSLIEHKVDDRYFGSTRLLHQHRQQAVTLGVITWCQERLVVTMKGRHWYNANLKQLKQCRGLYWSRQDVGHP